MKKYLFSIKVEADSEAKAIEKFQDENINPADIEKVDEKTWIDGKPCVPFTVIGFYEETNQKYTGSHYRNR